MVGIMNKTKIEWCDYTWNPIVGCKHNCKYCYARALNNRFKWIKDWTDPWFFMERLNQPLLVKTPSTIFVGSMCDVMGDWIPNGWIHKIIDVAKRCERHTFMFLTKNPSRYKGFNFPSNCMLGTTITGRGDLNKLSSAFLAGSRTFLSIEPIMGPFPALKPFELVIVGAMTGPGAIPPKKSWVKSVRHRNIFYKSNIKQFL
jgi:protein gp37